MDELGVRNITHNAEISRSSGVGAAWGLVGLDIRPLKRTRNMEWAVL